MTEDTLTTGQRIRVEALDAAIRCQPIPGKVMAAQAIIAVAKTYEDYIASEKRYPPASTDNDPAAPTPSPTKTH